MLRKVDGRTATGPRRLVTSLAIIGLFVLSLTTFGSFAAAAPLRQWVEVTSPHFVVVSDAGDKAALRAAWQFEQVRDVLRRLWPWARLETSKPFMIFAARDENSLKSLAPEYWETKGGVRPASVFVAGRDRHYIAIRSDVTEPDSLQANPYFQSYWSFVYITLESIFDRELPLWLGRGLSDVFANTIVRGKDLQVGRVVPWHLAPLREGHWLPLTTVLGVDRNSPYMTRQDEFQQFGASAWALVHYLAFGENGANAPRLNRFLERVKAGGDVNASLAEVYGPLDRLEAAVRNYVGRTLYAYQLLPLDVNVPEDGFKRRPLAAAESAGCRASLHAAMRRPVEARTLLQEATRDNPALPTPYEVEGILCDVEANKGAALAAYAKAVELGSTNFYTHYRHAQLLWSAAPDRALLDRIDGSLERSIDLNPNWAPGYSYLADVKVDLGEADAGLGFARRAIALEPRVSYHHAAAARSLARLSRTAEAVAEAEKALRLATDVNDRQRAEQLLAHLKGTAK